MAANRPGSPRMASEGRDKPRIQKAFGAGEQKLTRIEQERDGRKGGSPPVQGATVLHRLARWYGIEIQGATQGATKRYTGCYIFKV